MKRSLFIAIAVLILMALFVGCKAEIADRDELVEVTIDGGARALDISAESISTNPEGLIWYFTAEKKDNFFTTGETRDDNGALAKKALKTDAAAGLAGSLGEFSRGAWLFKFYGYDKALTDTTAKLIYSAESETTVGRTALNLTLTLKAESVGKSDIYVDGVTFDCAQLALDDYTGTRLVIKVSGTTDYPEIDGELKQGTRVYTFSSATPVFSSVDVGTYAVVFEVYGLFGTNEEEKIGEYPTSITVIDGMKYTISDNVTNPRIDAVDPTTAVIIAGADLPATKIQKDTQPLASTAVTFETSNTPETASNAKTTVVFEENSFTQTGDAELTVTTYNAGAADGLFQIQGSDNKAVAGLSFTLTSGATTISDFNDKYATVTTYIGEGVDNPTVVYVGEDTTLDQPEFISYENGYITFKTNHFSSFYVFEAEAKINDKLYTTLKEAFDAVPANTETTIVVLKDVVIVGNAGITVPVGKTIVLDLNGYTVKNAVNQDTHSQVITNKGTLTIQDSSDTALNGTGTGLLTNGIEDGTNPGEWWSTPQYNYTTNVITNIGTLTIKSGRIFNTAMGSICYGIDNNSGSGNAILNIEGGRIERSKGSVIRMFCNSVTNENTFNMTGGFVGNDKTYTGLWVQLPGSNGQAKKATLNITGGTLTGTYAFYDYSYGDVYTNVSYTITGGTFDGAIFSYGANSFVITGGVFNDSVYSKEDIEISGGSFSDSTVFYYLVDGANIMLLDDISVEDETIAFTTNVTVDLNQKALNLVRTASGPKSISVKDCAVEFKNGTINATLATDDTCVIYGLANSKITLSNVDIIARAHTYAVALLDDNAELIINGGSFTGMIGTLGHKRNAKVTINSGTFNNGCYFPATGTYIINDGTFNDLVEIKSGTLTINGGSFKCGTEGESQYVAYENGNAIHNAALGAVAYNGTIENNTTYGPTPVVNINGGTFNGAICKARKTADIDYPTFNIASGLNLEVVDLGVTD